MIAEVDYLLDDIGLDNYFEEGTTTIKAKKRKPTTKRKKNVSIALISERLRWENTLAIDNNQDIQSEWDPNNGLPHTGKWPIEEERFAHKLIQQFENGLLDDVEDGTTLRSYLAKTLKCKASSLSLPNHGFNSYYSLALIEILCIPSGRTIWQVYPSSLPLEPHADCNPTSERTCDRYSNAYFEKICREMRG